jgi:hypothetical protein
MAMAELVDVSNNKQYQTYIDQNRMKLCYLKTKCNVLGNRNSNLIDGQQIGTFQEIVMAFKNK